MIKKIFKYILDKTISEETRNVLDALNKVPGPSPWYLYKMGPKIPTNYGITWWEEAGKSGNKAGQLILEGGSNNLAVFNFYNWVQALEDSLLLVWNQKKIEKGPTAPVNLLIFDCNLFKPIDNPEEIYEIMAKQELFIYYKEGLKYKIDIPTTDIKGVFKLGFPEPLKTIDELLILAHSSAIGEFTWEKNNLCIISIKPKEGTYEFYPQDWFNNGRYDYGYEWVTRVAREPKSKKICGSGVKIRSFILDETNRNIEKYLY